MPVAVRATATRKERRWLKTRYRSVRHDVRSADGREEYGIHFDAVLQGAW